MIRMGHYKFVSAVGREDDEKTEEAEDEARGVAAAARLDTGRAVGESVRTGQFVRF